MVMAGIVLGLMGLAGIPLEIMTITIASIAIGIAVDNGIHYIYRYREEFPRAVTTLKRCASATRAPKGRSSTPRRRSSSGSRS
jgi:predicted RND superfamily exporter protein